MKELLTAMATTVLLVGCASTPPNEMLNSARAEYEQTRSMPGINKSSPAHMDSAKTELAKASSLKDEGAKSELIEHHALLSIKHLEIAQERLSRQRTQAEIKNSDTKRQNLLLTSREQDARRAETEAKSAEMKALAAKRAAESAREETMAAQQQLRDAQAAANELAAKVEALEAKASERGIVLTFEDVVFDTNSAKLQPGSERLVARVAEFLTEFEKRDILIEGSTDSTGAEKYNQDLSLARANSVKKSIVAAGIDASRIRTVGLGEHYPVASNDTSAGRQKNRRVDLIISNADGSSVKNR